MPKVFKHPYDLDILQLSKDIEKAAGNVNEERFDKVKYLERYRSNLNHACQFLRINYTYHEENNIPIIIDSDNNWYYLLFSIAIALTEIPEIKSRLDYHKKHYKGNDYADKNKFTILIEMYCLPLIKSNSLFDTDRRITEVYEWLREIKKSEEIKLYLKWLGVISELKAISYELWEKGYIDKNDAFTKVFTKTEQCEWLKDPECLAYLIFRLHKDKKLKVAPKGKGHFSVAQNYFYDYSGKVVKIFNLKDSLYNLRTRYASKHSKIKAYIDSLLVEIFKK